MALLIRATQPGLAMRGVRALVGALFLTALLLSGTPASAQPTGQTVEPTEELEIAPEQPIAPGAPTSGEDRRIRERLESAYRQIPALDQVEVAVEAGVVTLRGEVDLPSQSEAAEAIARRIEGIVWISNELVVTGEPDEPSPSAQRTSLDEAVESRLQSVFSQVEELREVDVDVRSGVVHLTGRVPSADAMTRAGELATGLEGAVYVDNDLEHVRNVRQRVSIALDQALEAAKDFVSLMPLLLLGLLVLVVFWYAARFAAQLQFPFRRLRDKPLIQGIVRQFVQVILFLIGVVIVLELFEVTALVGAVLGTAGVAGLAIGFAFRDIAENYLASLMLSMRQPFNKNDIVRIDTFEGKVVRLTTRDTVLMTLDGNHLRIPNSVVFKGIIYNFTRNPRRRFHFVVGIAVAEDLAEVVRIGTEALAQMDSVLDEPGPLGLVESLGDFAVNVQFFGWMDQQKRDFLGVRSDAIRRVKQALDAAGIDMPEPTQRVLQSAWEPRPKKGPARARDASIETGVTDQIDEQIAEDRAVSGEEDLLQ